MSFFEDNFVITLLTSVLAGFGLSAFFTGLAVTVLPKWGMMDIPRGRHQHERAVPRGGGIAIVLALAAGYGLYCFLQGGVSGYDLKFIFQFCPPLLVIVALGLWDDRCELKSRVKLAVQIIAALYLYFAGASINYFFRIPLPEYISLPLTVFWVVGMINAFNLIDGMDGVASGLAVIAACSMSAWLLISVGDTESIVPLLIFAGAALGFIRYNFPPAKIFLGDTGSMFIGLFFAYFSMMEATKKITLTTFLVLIMFIGIPVFDVFLAICRRVFRKYVLKKPDIGIMTGDHDHLHHRIQFKSKDSRKAVWQIYFLALMLTFGGFAATIFHDSLPVLSAVILLGVFFILFRYATIESYEVASVVQDAASIPRKNPFISLLHPAFDTLCMLAAFLLAQCLIMHTGFFSVPDWWLLLCCVAPYPLILGISGIYRTYWLRAGIVRFYRFFWLLLLASLIAFALAVCCFLYLNGYQAAPLYRFQVLFMVYVLLGLNMIFIERFMLHYMESFSYRNLAASMQISGGVRMPQTLVYGGGLNCRLFLLSHFSCSSRKTEHAVCGIIDDNPALNGSNVYGLEVLGTLNDLPAISKEHELEEIVVTLNNPAPEKLDFLKKFGQGNNIRVLFFQCTLSDMK